MKAFWDLFSTSKTITGSKTGLYEKLSMKFPDYEEDKLIEVACIAGLLTRVAFVDLDIHEGEREIFAQSLKGFTDFDAEEIDAIASLAFEEIRELAGRENHLYVKHLNPIMEKDQRFQVVRALFAIAAGDGEIDNYESEEIRIIVRGLELSDMHFKAARAEVADKLKSLKG